MCLSLWGPQQGTEEGTRGGEGRVKGMVEGMSFLPAEALCGARVGLRVPRHLGEDKGPECAWH